MKNPLSRGAVLSIVVRLVVFQSLLISHVSSVLLVSQCAGMANRALPKRLIVQKTEQVLRSGAQSLKGKQLGIY